MLTSFKKYQRFPKGFIQCHFSLSLSPLFKNKNKRGVGFTILELLIVIALIGLLASVLFVGYESAVEKARYAKAQRELGEIREAMLMYKLDFGELPPTGDSCPICGWPVNAADWTRTIDALINYDYLSARMDKDPWGNYYTYDDNDCNSNCGDSYIRTVGPDGVPSGDDYIVLVTSLAELSNCEIPCY